MRSRGLEGLPATRRHTPPPVPVVLQHLPRQGGYAVPWITLRHRGGTAILGAVDHDRIREAFVNGLCQVCGRPLGDRVVVLARPRDFAVRWVSEPGMHPECAAYSTDACPMLAGALPRYRVGDPATLSEPCGDALCGCRAWGPPDPETGREGQPAEPWFAIWLERAGYRTALVPTTGRPAVTLADIRPLNVLPLPASGATADQARTLMTAFVTLAFLADM